MGTSTGGIIAVGIGLMHMRVSELRKLYETLGKQVFKYHFGAYTSWVLRGYYYQASTLESALHVHMGVAADCSMSTYTDKTPKVA